MRRGESLQVVEEIAVHVEERWAGAVKAPGFHWQVTHKSLGEGHCFPLTIFRHAWPQRVAEGGQPSQGSPGPQLQECLAWVLVTFASQPVSGPVPS